MHNVSLIFPNYQCVFLSRQRTENGPALNLGQTPIVAFEAHVDPIKRHV